MSFQHHLYLNLPYPVRQNLGLLERPNLGYGTGVLPSLKTKATGKPEKTTGSAPVADTNVTYGSAEGDLSERGEIETVVSNVAIVKPK